MVVVFDEVTEVGTGTETVTVVNPLEEAVVVGMERVIVVSC